jgi:hypothetical protein
MKKIVGLTVVAIASCLLSVTCAVIITGCETGGDTTALTVEPSFVDLTSSSNGTTGVLTQTFTATGGLRTLSLPLEWSVSNPDLGSIAASGGYTASYVRTHASGDNSIIARDQYGAEGVATIRQ